MPEEFDRARVDPVGGKLWLAAAQQRGFAAACGAGDQRKRSFFDFRAKGPDKGCPSWFGCAARRSVSSSASVAVW